MEKFIWTKEEIQKVAELPKERFGYIPDKAKKILNYMEKENLSEIDTSQYQGICGSAGLSWDYGFSYQKSFEWLIWAVETIEKLEKIRKKYPKFISYKEIIYLLSISENDLEEIRKHLREFKYIIDNIVIYRNSDIIEQTKEIVKYYYPNVSVYGLGKYNEYIKPIISGILYNRRKWISKNYQGNIACIFLDRISITNKSKVSRRGFLQYYLALNRFLQDYNELEETDLYKKISYVIYKWKRLQKILKKDRKIKDEIINKLKEIEAKYEKKYIAYHDVYFERIYKGAKKGESNIEWFLTLPLSDLEKIEEIERNWGVHIEIPEGKEEIPVFYSKTEDYYVQAMTRDWSEYTVRFKGIVPKGNQLVKVVSKEYELPKVYPIVDLSDIDEFIMVEDLKYDHQTQYENGGYSDYRDEILIKLYKRNTNDEKTTIAKLPEGWNTVYIAVIDKTGGITINKLHPILKYIISPDLVEEIEEERQYQAKCDISEIISRIPAKKLELEEVNKCQ